MTTTHIDHTSGANPLSRLWSSPYLLLSGAAFLWASNFVIGRAAPSGLSPVSLCFWRWALAALIMLPFAWKHLKQDRKAMTSHWGLLVVLAGTGLAFSNLLAYVGLISIPSTTALLIQSALPVAILVMGQLLFAEKPTGRQIAATAVSILGIGSIVAAASGAGGGASWIGLAAVTAAMLSQATYTSFLRLKPAMHPTSFLFSTFALAALLLTPLELFMGTPLPVTDLKALATVFYIAVGPSILAFFLFNRGVALIGAGRSSIFFYLMPVFGGLLAVPLLGERLGMGQMAGFALIGAGFAIAVSQRKKRQNP